MRNNIKSSLLQNQNSDIRNGKGVKWLMTNKMKRNRFLSTNEVNDSIVMMMPAKLAIK